MESFVRCIKGYQEFVLLEMSFFLRLMFPLIRIMCVLNTAVWVTEEQANRATFSFMEKQFKFIHICTTWDGCNSYRPIVFQLQTLYCFLYCVLGCSLGTKSYFVCQRILLYHCKRFIYCIVVFY